MTEDLPNPLQTAGKIGLLGDLHGDVEHLFIVSRTMWARGISVLVQLGDWGFVWPGENWNRTLDKISRRLGSLGMTMFFLDGNHEWHTELNAFPIDGDGLRRLRPNVVHLPRGFRTTLSSGRTMAVLGGANSIDRDYRVPGRSWWPEESIAHDDLRALGVEHADIFLGHDAPLGIPELDRELAVEKHDWPWSVVRYAEEGRRMFDRGFHAVRPRLSVSGHYHRLIDVEKTFGGAGEKFICRAVVLDMNGANKFGQAILDVSSLRLEIFTRSDAAATVVTRWDSGKWLVRTSDTAVYAFDLDNGSVERRPGPGARSSPNLDQSRPLLDLRILHVGYPGIWSLKPADELVPDYEHVSPIVEKIERVKELR